MRTCDLCHTLAPGARSVDIVLIGVLKESQLTPAVVADILDKLQIKASILEPRRQAFGDVCEKCMASLANDASKAIDDGIKDIIRKLTDLGTKTKLKAADGDNSEMFHALSSEAWRGKRVSVG